MIETKDIKTFALSEDQIKAEDSVFIWLDATRQTKDENNFFKLIGRAGTGKTTLLNSILKRIQTTGIIRASKVCICAPTHKAKKVLGLKTGWGNSETLQALLGLKLDVNLEEFDPNQPAFSMIGDRKMRDYDLVIIDEASMVNTELYNTVTEVAVQCGSRVLFVGDSRQLNPVKEFTISPALLTPNHGYELTQIMRQADGNPLIALLELIRKDIEEGTETFVEYISNNSSEFNSNGEGYEVLTGEEFGSKLKEVFSSEAFVLDKNHARCLAWTNDCIGRLNKYIRDEVFAYKDRITEGELLLSYKTLVQNEALLLTNSDDYLVETKEDSFDNEFGLKIWITKLKGIDTSRASKVNILIPEAENLTRFREILEKLRNTALKYGGKSWKSYYKFRDKFVLLEPMMETYNAKKLLTKKDIDYGYGITIHKSQGSTYNTVFVNCKDINKNRTDAERKRLIYVALSRASHKVIISI